MKNIFVFGLTLIFNSAYAASTDYPIKCVSKCEAVNGSEFCVAKPSPDRTDVKVFFTAPNGDRILTSVYPYSSLEQMKESVIDKAKRTGGEMYVNSVKSLLETITCTHQEQTILLSEQPEMHNAF